MISSYIDTVLQLGALYGIVAIAVAISFRFLSFPDLTIDGSFVLGGVIAAQTIVAGHPVALALLLALAGGAVAGIFTATLHHVFGINKFFAGILSAMLLYSVNLRLLSTANLSLFGHDTFFASAPKSSVLLSMTCLLIAGAIAVLAAIAFRTRPGLLIRGVGTNSTALRLRSRGTFVLIAAGLGLTNGLAAVGGALIAQYQSFVDIGMGIGVTITAFAALFVGEAAIVLLSVARNSLSARRHAVRWFVHILPVDGELLAAVFGSIVLTAATSATLYLGLVPSDTKAVSALILIITMSIRRRHFSAILVPPSRFEA